MRLAAGSSPLARGLRFIVLSSHCRIGIIPARAGFTVHCSLFSLPHWDHPRSRGVYYFEWDESIVADGSSPLARGLPRPAPGGGLPPGIIPARAGFTAGEESTCACLSDHPRSRGVYV